MPREASPLKLHLNTWFLDNTNLVLSQHSLPYISPLSSFSRARYVREHEGCSTIAGFLFNCAGLGNKSPRPGRRRTGTCALCRGNLSEFHVAFLCPGMDDFRSNNTDIMAFLTMCRAKGTHPQLAYKWYITGLDWNRKIVPSPEYLNRGLTLKRLLNEWLRRT